MWESRRDFQRVWEGWEAGFMAFHAFHTLSFPWPAFGAAAWAQVWFRRRLNSWPNESISGPFHSSWNQWRQRSPWF
jgi:hypothetical protein